MQFSDFNLHERLGRAVEALGFTTPTPIQKKAIPVVLEGKDLIGTAATGTGKTAAFMLPILHLLLQDQKRLRSPRVLVVTPTRELAEQIKDVTKSIGRHTTIRCAVVYGGVGFQPQIKALKDGTEIIVCCPGRMIDMMKQGHADLSKIETVVLDEADRMLDMGFLPGIRTILTSLPRDRQTMLFSATFSPDLLDLIKQHLREPKQISISVEAPAETIDHCFYPIAHSGKTALLIAMLKSMKRDSVLVFTRTKHRANVLVENLSKEGFTVGVLHANKSQNARKAALDAFRSGETEILVATDIAARGIDVAGISHVINYDIPDTASNYIHRIGRAGRAEKQGDAMTFICNEDMSEVREIERRLGKPVPRKTHPTFDYSRYGADVKDSRPPQQNRGGSSGFRDNRRPAQGDRRPSSHDRKPHSENDRKHSFSSDRRPAHSDNKPVHHRSEGAKPRFERSYNREHTEASSNVPKPFRKIFSGGEVKFNPDKKREGGFKKDFRSDSAREPRKDFRKDFRSPSSTEPRKDFRKDFRSSSNNDSRKEYRPDDRKDSRGGFGKGKGLIKPFGKRFSSGNR